MSTTTTPSAPIPSSLFAWPRAAWLVGGGLLLVGAGFGAGVALRDAPTAAADAVKTAEAPSTKSGGVPQAPADGPVPATKTAAPAKATAPESRDARSAPARSGSGDAKPSTVAKAPPCTNCGVVDSVRTYARKGEGTGVGAVAGGVLGGVVGNQMGGGSGRDAMTVIGAVGGAVAGHEVEKRARSTQVTEVRVRMDDGTLRTVTLSAGAAAGVTPGDRVSVEGQSVKRVDAKQPA